MRYWINGEDEDYDRELERSSRFGGTPPAPTTYLLRTGLALLVGVQVLVFAFLIADMLVLR